MRNRLKLTVFLVMLALAGCHTRYTPPEKPMPANTVLLSEMMRELSAQPGFTEALLAQLEGAKQATTKRGPSLLTPVLIDELRKRILGGDWEGLDRFPGWTMRTINPSVGAAGRLATKEDGDTGAGAPHGGSPAPPLTPVQLKTFLDLGPYAPAPAETVSLDAPSALPPFTTAGLVTDLGAGVTRGDGPNELAA